jgi:hypothetical protein
MASDSEEDAYKMSIHLNTLTLMYKLKMQSLYSAVLTFLLPFSKYIANNICKIWIPKVKKNIKNMNAQPEIEIN